MMQQLPWLIISQLKKNTLINFVMTELKPLSCPLSNYVRECSGDNTNGLRPMTVVENKRLMAGHTFTTKEIVWMRIAEEANRRRI